ncbi:MAG: hypothetical protein IAE78_30230 [Myxococcus sp.]|nr:hypothetical protein [Myxococcus sp.]
MRLLLVAVVMLQACGRGGLSDEGAAVEQRSEADAGRGSDGGLSDAGGLDGGDPDGGLSDAGARWCAASSGACLADGWEFSVPGRCCLSRQTCKARDASGRGVCEY